MSEEALKIIFDVYKEKKILSQNDIYNILASLVTYNSLEDYCKSINVDGYDSDGMAYNFEEHEIIIDYEKVLKDLKKFSNKIKNFFKTNKEEKIDIINNEIVLGILHELNHVKQEKIKKENNSDLAELMKISFNIFNNKSNRFYFLKYDYIYFEYHACINAFYDLINNVLNTAKYKNSLITYIENINLALYLLKKYQIKDGRIITPIELFDKSCLKSKPLNPLLFEKVNQSKGNIEDILHGRIISSESLKYIDNIASRYVRTLNLFNDLYNNN